MVRRAGPRALVWAAFACALAAFTAHLDAEARFLAASAVVGWTGIALADRSSARLSAWAAALLVLAVVALPEGPGRALGVTTILLLLGTTALVRRWREEADLTLAPALGLALLAQAMFRPEWLLVGSLDLANLGRVLVVPLVVAAAFRWARRHASGEAAALFYLVTLLVCRGATLTAAFALVSPWLWELVVTSRRWGRAAVLLGAVAASTWQPLVVASGILTTVLRRASGLVLLASGVLASGLAWALGGGEEPSAWLTLVVVLPALVWPGLRRPGLAVGLLLLSWAGASLAGTGGLAVVAVLAVSRLHDHGSLPRSALPWAATVGVGLACAAAYPWMRADAVLWSALPWWAAPCAVASFAAGFELARRWRWGWPVVAAASWVILLASIDPAGQDLRRQQGAVVLNEGARFWGTDWGDASVCSLALESALADAATLPEGREVGWLGLLGHDGNERRLPLVVGVSTGEWAARKVPGAPAPPAWLHWVATDSLFGQRYRARWRVEPGAFAVRRVRVVRSPDLPAEVELIVWRLQVGRC